MDSGKDTGGEVEGSHTGQRECLRRGGGRSTQWDKGKDFERDVEGRICTQWTAGKIKDVIWKDHTMDKSLDSGRDVEGSHTGQRERYRRGSGRITQWTAGKFPDGMWKDHKMDSGKDLGRDLERSYHG
ncbi:hypothetical protein RRG08_001369 [Elysia crispata]|uniref:Uncharacterized protein n=1 Tax=Elysia crispata TaxID=231223 RepID=A0AAE0ZXD8_9GAST|nr:hypothetical protein RRG08_001369 [Elysia crispata]